MKLFLENDKKPINISCLSTGHKPHYQATVNPNYQGQKLAKVKAIMEQTFYLAGFPDISEVNKAWKIPELIADQLITAIGKIKKMTLSLTKREKVSMITRDQLSEKSIL